jgi:hypothetical protein
VRGGRGEKIGEEREREKLKIDKILNYRIAKKDTVWLGVEFRLSPLLSPSSLEFPQRPLRTLR